MNYVESVGCAVLGENRGTHEEGEGEIRDAYGATKVVYCWGDQIPSDEMISFPKAVQCKDDKPLSVGRHLWSSSKA